MKHCVYIRFNYTDFPLFLKRLDIMKATSVPSLSAQTGEFNVQIGVNNELHAKIVAEHTPFKPVLKFDFDSYDIQTRHDSDDIVLPGYIEKIQSFYDGTPKVVTFQVQKLDWSSGETYEPSRLYTADNCSMFSSIMCLDKETNIMSHRHRALGELASVTVVGEGMCFLVVHGVNKSSTIRPKEKAVGAGHSSGNFKELLER